MDIPSDPAAAARLAYLLFGAGVVLLAMELFFVNRVFAVFGGLAMLGSSALAFARVSIEVGSLLLLGGVTLVSLGFLVMLAFFPGATISRQFTARVAQSARGDAEQDGAEDRDRE